MRQVIGATTLAIASLVAATSASAFEYPRIMTSSEPLLVAFDARTGNRSWRMRTDEPGQLGVVAASRTRVFAELRRCMQLDREPRSGDSALVAVDASTGRRVWERKNVLVRRNALAGSHVPKADPGWWTTNPDTFGASGSVIPLTSWARNEIRAVDPSTGSAAWRAPLDGFEPVAATRDLLFLARPEGSPVEVRALDALTGDARWTRAFPTLTGNRLAAHGNTVVLVASTTSDAPTPWRVVVLDAADGSTRAETSLSATESILDELALDSDVGIARFRSGLEYWVMPRNYGFATASGTELWSVDGSYPVLARAGGVTIAFGDTPAPIEPGSIPRDSRGGVTALDATTAELLWSLPAIGYARGTARGVVVAVEAMEYEGSFTVVDRIHALDARTGRFVWEVAPGGDTSERTSRRYRDIFTTGAFVGPRAVYVDGGCALTGLN